MEPVVCRMNSVEYTVEQIESIRYQFRQAVNESPDLFDEKDISNVESDDWTIKRFLGHKKGNIEEAAASLIKAMKWRKENDVNNIKITDQPVEFFWTGECHNYVRDKNNCIPIYCRVKYHKPLTDLNPIEKKFLIYMLEKVDREVRETESNGWAIIYDCSGGTIFNNNMDILFFMIETIFEFYPMTLTYIGLVDLPWVMRAIYTICRGLIPEEYRNTIRFFDRTSIKEFVGEKNLPDYLDGTCDMMDRTRVPGAITLREYGKLHDVKEASINKFFAHYQKYLDIGDQEERKRQSKDKIDEKKNGVNNNNRISIQS